ncbi:MAG: hypothetical protein ABH870_00170 [bacterium]
MRIETKHLCNYAGIQNPEFRMEMATTRGEHLLVHVLTIITPE